MVFNGLSWGWNQVQATPDPETKVICEVVLWTQNNWQGRKDIPTFDVNPTDEI